MDDYTKGLQIKAPVAQVYKAISTQNGVQEWWTRDCRIDTMVGGEATFRFEPGIYATMKIRAMTDNQEVMWGCTSQHFPAQGSARTDEWVGTTLRFHLNDNGDGTTILSFTHEGLTPKLDCYKESEAGWNYFLDSLKKYAEVGRGTPYTPQEQLGSLFVHPLRIFYKKIHTIRVEYYKTRVVY